MGENGSKKYLATVIYLREMWKKRTERCAVNPCCRKLTKEFMLLLLEVAALNSFAVLRKYPVGQRARAVSSRASCFTVIRKWQIKPRKRRLK